MKKVLKVFLIIIFGLIITQPINTFAEDYQTKLHNNCAETCVSKHDYSQECINKCIERNDRCKSILGDPTKEETMAWLVQQIFTYIKFLGPLIVLILSSIDFAKTIIQNDEETMKKAQKKLIIRLVAVVLLFFVPDFVTVIMQTFGLSDNPTCGIG
ncbi:MAG: hypothetical protein E7160_01330 [Firmicutes bacterium]|nr:hypothetical protein [Bacillota bacterium]